MSHRQLEAPSVARYFQLMAEEASPEYRAMLQRLSGAQKLSTAFGLYWEARELKAARLREEHPEWTDEQVLERTKEIFMHADT